MTYQEAVAYIDETPKFTKKNSLEHTRAFLKRLGDPQENMKILHVAGTNGKGSVCSFLASMLKAAGKRTGLFTSPHLVKINERFVVDEEEIGDEEFLEAFHTVMDCVREMREEGYPHPTYFELLFLIGMKIFEKAGVEYLVLETGLGAQMTVRLMDSAMAGEGSAESLPTLDLCSLDLYEGECTFLKAGAAASFIKRGSAVERITGTALPLGACGDAQPQPIKRSVSDGDYIVMMTDGMTEGWPNGDGEKQLETLLSGINGISPSEMAGILLRFAIEQRGGRIRDDMTVLCAGIWEKGEGL